MRTSHAASKCSVLSVAHALDEVACSRVGLAEKPKDKRSDAAERAETRDEGTEFTWYSMGEFHVELAELGFNLGEDGGGATLHSTRGIRTGSGRVLERVVLDGVQRLELEEVIRWFSGIERRYADEEVRNVSASVVKEVCGEVDEEVAGQGACEHVDDLCASVKLALLSEAGEGGERVVVDALGSIAGDWRSKKVVAVDVDCAGKSSVVLDGEARDVGECWRWAKKIPCGSFLEDGEC